MNAQSDLKTMDLIPPMQPLEPPFRLPEAWYRWNMARLQAKLQQNGLDGVILEDVWNIIYFSGLFHSKTERPFWLFVPAKGEPVIYHPALDRDLVDTWWIQDAEWYFDYPHHGAYDTFVCEPGPAQDLLQWMLGSLGNRGFDHAALGIESEPGPSVASRMRAALPQATFRTIGDLCLKMRQIKDAEELAMTQKALDLQDHMLEYARAFILQYGSSVTDYHVQVETKRYITDLLMGWLKPDGRPHNAVGIDIFLVCRAGASTAYPHPNQFYYHKIKRGDAIQLAGWVHFGGYVGECYRAVQLAPMNDLQKKTWEVHTQMTELQAELCRAGLACNEIASHVLKLPRDAGLEEFVYHRPAHGIGMEGHQAPCLALGDETVLQEGMLMSNEPGLYNPQGGWGYNHSNTILVGKERGIVLNNTPLTKDWCWLTL